MFSVCVDCKTLIYGEGSAEQKSFALMSFRDMLETAMQSGRNDTWLQHECQNGIIYRNVCKLYPKQQCIMGKWNNNMLFSNICKSPFLFGPPTDAIQVCSSLSAYQAWSSTLYQNLGDRINETQCRHWVFFQTWGHLCPWTHPQSVDMLGYTSITHCHWWVMCSTINKLKNPHQPPPTSELDTNHIFWQAEYWLVLILDITIRYLISYCGN